MKPKRTNKRKIPKNKTRKNNKSKKSKKWVSAIDAAQKTLYKTGDIKKARLSLKKQALLNARKLFGSVSTS